MDELFKWLPLILALVGWGVAWGEIKAKMAAFQTTLNSVSERLKQDLARLEGKQDKYNHLQERTTRLEESAKSAHKRLTEIECRVREYHH